MGEDGRGRGRGGGGGKQKQYRYLFCEKFRVVFRERRRSPVSVLPNVIGGSCGEGKGKVRRGGEGRGDAR